MFSAASFRRKRWSIVAKETLLHIQILSWICLVYDLNVLQGMFVKRSTDIGKGGGRCRYVRIDRIK